MLESHFARLEEKVRRQLEEDGVPADRLVIQRIAECRYLGQGYELRVDAPSGAIDDGWAERIRSDFHDIHEREYSRRFDDSDIEIPNVRVRGIGLMPELSTPEVEHGGESPVPHVAMRGRHGSGSMASCNRCTPSTTTEPH